MKKLIFVVCVIILLIGCGERKEVSQKKSEAKTKKNTNYVAQGFQYLAQQDVPHAIQSFDLAIKNDPGNSENYLVLGKVYMKLKNLSRAIDTFAAATRVNPNDGQAYQLLAASLGARSENAEDQMRAIEAARRSVEIFLGNQDEENFKNSAVLLKNLQEKFSAVDSEK